MLNRRDLIASAAGAAALVANPPRIEAQTRAASLTVAVDNLWSTMEPIWGISTTGRRVMVNFYDNLVERDFIADPNGLVLAPKLATKWEQRGNVWHFELRQGVKFHNGVEMTAEDVAFTLSSQRLWGERPIAPRGRTFTAGFRRVEATGKYTFEIETARPDPYIPHKLTGAIGQVVPREHYLAVGHERFGQMPIGTGPYRVTRFSSAEAIVMEAFGDYWGGRPAIDRLTFRIVPEFAARLAGLVSGEFDFIVNIPTDQERVVSGYRNIKLVKRQADNYPAFAFNVLPDPPDNPLVDANLRLAMVQGVNMPEIVQALFGDSTFFPAVPFNFREYGRFYDPNARPRLPFDQAAARARVRRTSYNGQPLRWHITRQFFPNYEAAAEIMVEQWREIGVNVQAIILDNFDLVYRRPFHMMNMSMNSSFIPGDPYQPLWLDWGPTATRSTAHWRTWTPTPRFVELGNAFDAATEFEARKAAFQALSSEWQDVTPGMYMWKSVYNWAHKANFDWKPIADTDMRFYGGYFRVV